MAGSKKAVIWILIIIIFGILIPALGAGVWLHNLTADMTVDNNPEDDLPSWYLQQTGR